MPLQNRVTPEGAIVATTHRGTMMGNRGGCFHTDEQVLRRTHWAAKRWICCVLSFKARKRALMQPGLYTELFFLDEATAMAAGHRPCFECRRADAVRFQQLWAATVSKGVVPRVDDMDEMLHAERLVEVARKPSRRMGELPDGVMVSHQGAAHVVHARQLRPWSFEGYGPPVAVTPSTAVVLLTPPSTVAVIAAGYQPGVKQ